ncbi:MAG TPA: VWA domain-containing protein [Streptosporangiaceae bacterium]|jgi:uncharacterized protein with von Willebrand factor type A (vWA) domain
MGTLAKLKDLAAKAGRWLGLGTTAAAPTAAIVADRFDEMTWAETLEQAAALRDLADDLADTHDYAAELLRDVFLAAYKAAPQLRERAEMDPSRLVNHQVIASLLDSPEFAELRRETAGDPYAAAMAVLAQASALRRMLAKAEDAQQAAQQAAQARQDAAGAAQAVQDALDTAAAQASEDGDVPADAAAAVQQADGQAEAATQAVTAADAAAAQALAAAAPGIRAAARAAAQQATGQVREETAVMRAWGVGPGELQRMSFAQRARLAGRLRSGRLGEWAQLIGRFRQMSAGERARKTEHAPGELVGITLGDDLGRLIPSETAALGVPALRAAFAARYAEQRLFIYETRGEAPAGQGAIIACIDTSGSMRGGSAGGATREAWAKACALALLDQARTARRDFAGILFSSAGEQMTFRFPAARPAAIGDVLDFAEFFYGGGTDFQTPLDAAADLLEDEYNNEGRMRGDIVLITDGHSHITEDWMRSWNDRKAHLGYRVFGVAVETRPGPVLEALTDNLRAITDLAAPDAVHAAAGMFRVI